MLLIFPTFLTLDLFYNYIIVYLILLTLTTAKKPNLLHANDSVSINFCATTMYIVLYIIFVCTLLVNIEHCIYNMSENTEIGYIFQIRNYVLLMTRLDVIFFNDIHNTF